MPAKLTLPKVRKFEAGIRRKYADVVFELTYTRNLERENVVELSKIIVRNRKRGKGTSILRELCAFADRHNVQIRLTPASKGDYEATTSRARLIRFYKRFGFEKDRADPAEFTAVPTMSRQPKRTQRTDCNHAPSRRANRTIAESLS